MDKFGRNMKKKIEKIEELCIYEKFKRITIGEWYKSVNFPF